MLRKLKSHYLFNALALVAAIATPIASAQFSSNPTTHVQASLLVQAPDGAQPGSPIVMGVKLTPEPGWHTYWKNPGDAGLATELQWTLPDGVAAGDVVWPAPHKITTGGLVSFGFDGPVMLTVPLVVGPSFKAAGPAGLVVKLKASWIACNIECIPEERELALQIAENSATAGNAAAFESATAEQAKRVQVTSSFSVSNDLLKVSIAGLPDSVKGQPLVVFPVTPGVVNPAANWVQKWEGSKWTSSVALSKPGSNLPEEVPIVLVSEGKGVRSAFEVTVKREQAMASQPATTADTSPPLDTVTPLPLNWPPLATVTPLPLNEPPAASIGLWAAVLGAFLGGLILNLMPCVFPVLAMKVLSFTSHADDRRGHRISGLYYTAGVVLSFTALGAIMLLLRSVGATLGWGFQLQSPVVVATLAVLFTVMGLNLAGMFEFGQFVPSKLASHQAKSPAVNSFLSGMLAVAVASPCTAPFMGASLGFALGLPAAQALLIFASIGLGMALPYLGASFTPSIARLLPRPGAWMNTFRSAMAFPMFATVVWLVWVVGQQTGPNGAAALLALLLAVSMAIWAWRLNWIFKTTSAIIFIAAVAVFTWVPSTKSMPDKSVHSAAAWSPALVESEIARGVPVFVDFTAAWCVTCQYNKTVLSNALVQQDFELHGVTVLRADWTNRDPLITEALGKLGRNGVPVYVLYQAGKAPRVLSELLTVAEVKAALAQLAK